MLSFKEMDDEPLLDIVQQPGDILYVPTGFPHITDTSTDVTKQVDGNDESVLTKSRSDTDTDKSDMFQEMSVHLIMGLDTHVWSLSYAHLRWAVLQRCGMSTQLNVSVDRLYWKAMETIPIEFLASEAWRTTLGAMKCGEESIPSKYRQEIIGRVKEILRELEPQRLEGEQQ